MGIFLLLEIMFFYNANIDHIFDDQAIMSYAGVMSNTTDLLAFILTMQYIHTHTHIR
jgi:hypothetical protein